MTVAVTTLYAPPGVLVLESNTVHEAKQLKKLSTVLAKTLNESACMALAFNETLCLSSALTRGAQGYIRLLKRT